MTEFPSTSPSQDRQKFSSGELQSQLSMGLSGLNRIAYRTGYMNRVIGGGSHTYLPKGKQVTKADAAVEWLTKKSAVDFKTGFSANQVSKAIGCSRATASEQLNKLVDKGYVKSEQQGSNIRYFIPPLEPQPSTSPEP